MNTRVIAEFHVDGIPKGQPRQRSFALRGKGGKPKLDAKGRPIIRSYDPSTAEGWKNAIATAAREYLPFEPSRAPIAMRITFYFARPKRLCRRADPDGALPHIARPDADNCAKAVIDCLKTVGMYRDDSQVAQLGVVKLYHAKQGRPGADITIEELDTFDADELGF